MRSHVVVSLAAAGFAAACASGRNYAPVEYRTARPAAAPSETRGDIRARPEPVSAENDARPAPFVPRERRGEEADRYASAALRSAGAVEEGLLDPVSPQTDALAEFEPRHAVERRVERAPSAPPVGYVKVEPGDTVYAIGRRTGADPDAIIAANAMQPPYLLSVGEFVRVPGAAGDDAARVAATPTDEARPDRAASSAPTRTVGEGDTLYSIARLAGSDVATVARLNGLTPPYTLAIGQTLRLPGGSDLRLAESGRDAGRRVEPEPAAAPAARPMTAAATVKPSTSSVFDWPVRGPVIAAYGVQTSGRRNDGVNIAAPAGAPVRAAASGTVIYKGSELEGYGNLILIKHADDWVTAYAHADQILVNKGDKVEKGQIVGKVGSTGSVDRPQLHFELRRKLKAVDPMTVLAAT